MLLSHWSPFSELRHNTSYKPTVDVYEDDAAVQVKMDVPGLKSEDIKISVEDHILTIQGERKLDHKGDGYHRVERFFGSFKRSFSLPEEVNADEIEAKYESGVLTVRLPKRASAKRREVPVLAS